jgi:hypothetical protein
MQCQNSKSRSANTCRLHRPLQHGESGHRNPLRAAAASGVCTSDAAGPLPPGATDQSTAADCRRQATERSTAHNSWCTRFLAPDPGDLMNHLAQGIRIVLCGFRGTPAFTATVVLALGIGPISWDVYAVGAARVQ